MKQKTKEEQSIEILKRVAKRVEDATIDIHDIKFDLKTVKLRLGQVEDNTKIMRVDTEKTREELVGLEVRLNKRITNVADLITIQLGGKIQNHEKRIKKIERLQQAS